MDGVLVLDKPPALTSHDVVAAARRALGQQRIGHTGTLDPLATGVLPLALGRATRLVRFLTASDKEYEAVIRFGLTTDTYDITGTETSQTGEAPSRDQVLQALEGLQGEYLQTPPAYSAKKVDGQRAYAMARRQEAPQLEPVPVRVSRVELLALDGARAQVRLTCSAGFYVRSFAHDLGARTGTGACLEALRRTRSGEFAAGTAVPIEMLGQPSALAGRIVPMERLLTAMPAVEVTDRGRAHVSHGRGLDAGDYAPYTQATGPVVSHEEWVRLLDVSGMLIAMATPGDAPGSLRPAVVLI